MVVAHRQLRPVDARVVGVIVAPGAVGHGGEGGGHSVDLCQHIVAFVDLTRNAQKRMIFVSPQCGQMSRKRDSRNQACVFEMKVYFSPMTD